MKRLNIILLVLVIISIATSVFLIKRTDRLRRDIKHQNIKIENLLGFRQALTYESIQLEKLAKLNFIDNKTIEKGKEEMAKHKAVFVGISRDNAGEIAPVMRHMEYIGGLFEDYRVIIFENDSKDGTKFLLNKWAEKNSKVKIIMKDVYNKKRPSIQFMADARNQYLSALKGSEYKDFDIIIPVDMDMKYGIDIRGIEQTFSQYDKWDGVCANGIFDKDGRMWDAFAFRNEEFTDSIRSPKGKYLEDKKKKRQKIYHPNSDLIPVTSCFGGMAIYKRKFIGDCKYKSINRDCEHVCFHNCVIEENNARMFMNPAMIIRYSHY